MRPSKPTGSLAWRRDGQHLAAATGSGDITICRTIIKVLVLDFGDPEAHAAAWRHSTLSFM